MMDKQALGNKIKQLEGLTNDEKSALLELLNSQKKYGLVWEDKPEEVEEQLREKIPILTEVKERAILNDTETDKHPNHILIEGDNLHALTSLCYTHEGKVDVIYIDPPYNTGNKDFVYNDSFVDSEDSFRHSKWLSFMERRLKLAKRLLSEEGVIFISIDDNEAAQLKLLCDEVFSEGNCIGPIVWKKKTNGNNMGFIPPVHDYFIVYAKNQVNLTSSSFGYPITEEYIKKNYSNPDSDPRGLWTTMDLSANHKGPYFSIMNPVTKEYHYPANGRYWVFNEGEVRKRIQEGRIIFGKTGTTKPVQKVFFNEKKSKRLTVESWWDKHGMNEDGTAELNDLFSSSKKFIHPKPIQTIENILKISTFESALILDFFAGSGTTLHATMQLNATDGGQRQCILVTNNENNICEEVTYERNKRVINGYTTPKEVEVKGLSDNNLRYYRTNFIERKQTQRNKRQLVVAATDLLCIKENIYIEQTQFGSLKLQKQEARFFAEKGKQMLILYKEEMIDDFIEQIERLNFDGKLKIYVFAPGEYPYTDDFEMVLDKVELCALPDAIYKAYKQVLPAMKEAVVETHAVEIDELDNDHWEISE